MVAVCLFPIGLLALLIRPTRTVTLTASATGNATTIAASGNASPWARDVTTRALDEVGASGY